MKKIVVITVFLVVIGVICVAFCTRGNKEEVLSDERPWTVGEDWSEPVSVEKTTEAPVKDDVMTFSDYVHTKLREDYTFVSQEDTYTESQLKNALLGMYVYDLDGDSEEELTLVRTTEEGAFLDVYEYKDGKVLFADSAVLKMDPMDDVNLSGNLNAYAHIAGRLSIYPQSQTRHFCATVETEDKEGEYNAYTAVFSYDNDGLKKGKSYRLRQKEGVVTLMCTDDVSLLYRAVAGEDGQAESASDAKYNDLDMAFKLEFGKIGLSAPSVKIEKGKLTQYKVVPVENAQIVFEFTAADGKGQFSKNGFLQSFVF